MDRRAKSVVEDLSEEQSDLQLPGTVEINSDSFETNCSTKSSSFVLVDL